MGIPYFNNFKWSDITRDERFFCSALYHHASKNPADFAGWVIGKLNEKEKNSVSVKGDWDLGYEVCFYRDFLWHHGKGIKDSQYPPKRTFDLCLFNENAIIIIEAKAHEGFKNGQMTDFNEDPARIVKLFKELGLNPPKVITVYLCASRYVKNMKNETRKKFQGGFSWLELHQEMFPSEPLLELADKLYGANKENGELLVK